MNPRAIEGLEVLSGEGADVTLRHPTRGEIQLRGVAARVWRQADGDKSIAQLAAAVGADEAGVWAALDELGDAELLTERATPPEGIHESVQREVTVVGDGAGSDGPAELEAKFDRQAEDAARGGDLDIKVPQAGPRGDADGGASAAEAEALAQLDGRSDDGASPSSSPAEEAAPSGEPGGQVAAPVEGAAPQAGTAGPEEAAPQAGTAGPEEAAPQTEQKAE